MCCNLTKTFVPFWISYTFRLKHQQHLIASLISQSFQLFKLCTAACTFELFSALLLQLESWKPAFHILSRAVLALVAQKAVSLLCLTAGCSVTKLPLVEFFQNWWHFCLFLKMTSLFHLPRDVTGCSDITRSVFFPKLWPVRLLLLLPSLSLLFTVAAIWMF